MNYSIEKYLSQDKIEERVTEIAKEIEKEFRDEEVILIGLLRGSVIFLADLARKVDLEVKIDFMVVSSYENSMESSRNVKIKKDLEEDISDKNIVIVEDIIDTGHTLNKIVEILETRKPKKLKICTLLDKPDRREVDVHVDYIGFKIPDEFVVGYGIDYAQRHRNLPYIGIVKQS